jgi:hypothetical protein
VGWDIENEFDAERSGWAEEVKETIPRVEEDELFLLRKVDQELNSLKESVDGKGATKGNGPS